MKSLKYNLIYAILIIGLMVSCDNDDNGDPNPDPEQSCIPANLQNDIIAFYPFSGGSLNDYSGNGYDLSNSTTAFASQDRAGNPNCAFEFVAANNDFLTYVNPVIMDNFDSQPFSVSLWFKTEGNRDGGEYEQLIGRGTGLHCPDTYGEWSVGLYDCRNSVFGINDYSLWGNGIANPYGDTTCINDPSKNVWHHLVVTSDGSAGGTNMYIDGVQTTNSPGTGCNNPHGTNPVGDLFLGKEFTGILDDVILFSKVLTNAEVLQLYESDACCQ